VKIWKILSKIVIILSLLLPTLSRPTVHAVQTSSAEDLLQMMTAREKIGQLFLVTYTGLDVGEETEIFDLITNHHVGGVVLLAENDNFTSTDTILQTQEMIRSLQTYKWEASSEGSTDNANTDTLPEYVPLFVGLKQIGNGSPGDQILTGMTELPSQMAIGAAWDFSLSQQVGEVLGAELSVLGINMFLGPNLDVLETANSESATSLGVNTYGGDPFWVGEMGKAFISGLHVGSNNRMLVVAQNFPGTGNSDRSPEFEVATVRKSLEQLKQIELAPYFSVTTPDVGSPTRVDAVMVSHIRYQGFQGNIRATTKPISFDSNALQQIMALPEFAAWRESGGLVISDNLGSGAVRRFFDPNETNFRARQVALDAFLAGNDILYLDDFIASADPDAYTTLLSTIDFFVQKYLTDSAFAKKVDTSVLRILSAKENLFGDFQIANVISSQTDLETLGQSQDITFDVAQNAVTLINPSSQELDVVLPSPPLAYEDIIIFTDVRMLNQCNGCPPSASVNTNALATALSSLYGPQSGGQISQNRLASYTFTQLADVLNNIQSESAEFLSLNLRNADWVIFNSLDVNPEYPSSNALQRVLSERPDLLSGKNVIVFAMDLPTYLDATNISKITAYYALYSKTPAFLDIAARVLMKEIDPPGALPISLKPINYDLISITSPDPDQIIRLNLVLPVDEEEASQTQTPEADTTPEPSPTPDLNVGDTIVIQTGEILDHNQNMVPDGTIVRFMVQITGDSSMTQQFDATTKAGVAQLNYRVESVGGLEISAGSEPAVQSETLQINISSEGITSVIAVSPTPLTTSTPTESPILTPTDNPEGLGDAEQGRNVYPTLGEWALSIIVMGVGGVLTYLIGYYWWGTERWGLRSALCALAGALLTYSYLNFGFAGVKFWMEKSGTVFVVEMVVVGLLIGWIGALIWWMRTEGRYPIRRRS